VDDLHPDRREESHVQQAGRQLHEGEAGHGPGDPEGAAVVGRLQDATRGEGHEEGPGQGQDRVGDPQLHQEVRGGRDVLGEAAEDRLGRVERVAERGHGAALADTDEGEGADPERPAKAGDGLGPQAAIGRAPVGGEGQAGQEDERVRQVAGHKEGAGDGVVSATGQRDEPGPDRGFDEDEEDRRAAARRTG
jgi:hypothetical protein